MRLISEFRDQSSVKATLEAIRKSVEAGRSYRFMEFCGGHTHSLFRFGLIELLPANIRMLHGPGCPVCVLPISRIDAAIELSLKPGVVLCSYGDMLRVPASRQDSLLKAKARGADVRMIYSPAEILDFAANEPKKQFIFFAVGFETTTPPTAVILDQCQRRGLKNLQVFCNHVLTPPAIRGVLSLRGKSGEPVLDGMIGPGHVSMVTGTDMYEEIVRESKVPIVISGFEPLDLLQSILLLVLQVNRGESRVENQYQRVVTAEGNRKARALMEQYFQLRPSFAWRGLGNMADSALRIHDDYQHLDAEVQFALSPSPGADNKACECPAVLAGLKSPLECKLFDNPCTPENPLGACMVSSEGACAAYFTYQRHRHQEQSIAQKTEQTRG